MKKYSALFFASFFAFVFVVFFQNVQLAQAWLAEGDLCNPQQQTICNSFQTCDQFPQSTQNEICDLRTDACLPVTNPRNSQISDKCEPNQNVNKNPGGGTKTTLSCSCESENDINNNKYTCTGSNGATVKGTNGQTEDKCLSNEVCQKGSASDIRQVFSSSQSIFDPNKYRLSGIICSTKTSTAACTCDPKDPNKINCTDPNANPKTQSTSCINAFTCKTTSNPNQQTDRGQIKDINMMPNSTLQGVECVRQNATCTCDDNGKDGKMTCTLNGAKSPANCTGAFICTNNKNATITNDKLQSVPSGFANIALTGVECTAPALLTPTLPPPPSPPCAKWVNGQCTSFASALGGLSTDPAGLIQSIFAILLSVSGGIALLLIIRSGYQLMVSQGKPEQIQQGREQLIAAIVGLVFLIFSFVFLQLIGYDILRVPGFGTGSGSSANAGANPTNPVNTAGNPPPAAPAPPKTVTHQQCTGPNACPNGQTCVGYNAAQCTRFGTSCTGTCN